MNLVIGSGDTTALLSGKNTQGFANLIQKFVANDKPYYNAFASPINALRTGAILESKYLEILSDDYFFQWKETADTFDCLVSSIDFAKIKNGNIIDFDELKTIYLTEYIDIILPLNDLEYNDQIKLLKSKFKSNYNQVQFQLLCSGLNEANLVFLAVESYEDDENKLREITENDFTKFRIKRDELVIAKIMERATIFQTLKNNILC